MSTQLYSRAFQIVPALMIRTAQDLQARTSDPICRAPPNYHCCSEYSEYLCENGYECDIPNKQCVKKTNVALIAGIVVAIVVLISSCVGCALRSRKQKALATAPDAPAATTAPVAVASK
ncbi:hypothetical protein HDU97_004915 [Phlyctochytrium planicorne]|nr:hypothetical protein HDU97_004915 [Phlyctochytrium planicorne]